jgi:hypothetical protein
VNRDVSIVELLQDTVKVAHEVAVDLDVLPISLPPGTARDPPPSRGVARGSRQMSAPGDRAAGTLVAMCCRPRRRELLSGITKSAELNARK